MATKVDLSKPDQTGPFLAGIGHVFDSEETNYFTVKSETTNAQIEAAFVQLAKRPEVGVILISQHIANRIRRAIEAHMSQKNGGSPRSSKCRAKTILGTQRRTLYTDERVT
ncbi:hypothetical protein TrVGV298_001240 [Trichoderma virens]|nr:hypothetical protein TrVGV298_001240 [Trichoderma virens]